MITKMLKVTLAASMVMPAVSAILPGNTVLAQELPAEAVRETQMDKTIESTLEMTDITETPELDGTVELPMLPEQAETEIVLPETGEITEETVAPEVTETVTEDETEAAVAEKEESDLDARRRGTDVGCGLTLDVLVNGVKMETAEYSVAQGDSDVQLGGTLDLTKVWNAYRIFKFGYVHTNGEPAFRSKSLIGSYTYSFSVNPEVVTVNEDILCSEQAWQTAFETGSPAASGFFSYMRCSEVNYDENTGKVDVIFTINENGTNQVKVSTIEDTSGSRPDTIQAYSPAGAFTIKPENFKKGVKVFTSDATFKGEIDMAPWMALVFPIRFEACVKQHGLTLDVADAQVTFDVENGTWADGTADTLTRNVEVDVIKMSEGSHVVAGTLAEEMIPAGMIAAEGYDQENGAWDKELVTEENGLIFLEGGIATMSEGETANDILTIGYTYSFPGKPGDPNPGDPNQPAYPGEDDNKPGEDDNKPGEDNKPGTEETGKNPGTTGTVSGNKKPSRNKGTASAGTSAATGLAGVLGLQALSVAGIVAILKRKRK